MTDEATTDRRTVLKSALAGLGILGTGGAGFVANDRLGSSGDGASGGTNGTAADPPTPVREVRTPSQSGDSNSSASSSEGDGSGSDGSGNSSSGSGPSGDSESTSSEGESDSGGTGSSSNEDGDDSTDPESDSDEGSGGTSGDSDSDSGDSGGDSGTSSDGSGNDSDSSGDSTEDDNFNFDDELDWPQDEVNELDESDLTDPTLTNPTLCYRGDPSAVADSGAVEVEVTPESKSTGSTSAGEKSEEEGKKMICTTQKRDLREGGGEVILLDPQLSTIWPGAILEAGSIANGQFSPALSQDRLDDEQPEDIREPIQLSISPSAVNGNATTTLQTPTVGNYRSAKNQLLSRFNGSATPAAMSVEIKRIHSDEQLGVELGAHFESSNVEVDNEFTFSNENRTNKLLATVKQRYYSVDVSTPNPKGDGFVDSECQPLHRNDVLINSVSYGRVLLFAIESEYSHERVENALEVSVDTNNNQVDTNVGVEYEQVLDESSISMQVIGGSATDGARAVSGFGEKALPALKRWIEDGATFDPDSSPGAPIAYQAKYPKTLDTANVYLTTRYTARNCYPVTRKYRVHNFSWKVRNMSNQEGGNKEEIYGDIYINGYHDDKGLKFPPRGAPHDGNVWDKGKSQWVKVREGNRKHISVDETLYFYDIKDLQREKSYIKVGAKPRESDTLSDDDYDNFRHIKWYLDESPSDPNTAGNGQGKFTIVWNDHGSELELSFDISPVPP